MSNGAVIESIIDRSHRSVAEFYSAASVKDAESMDELIKSWVDLTPNFLVSGSAEGAVPEQPDSSSLRRRRFMRARYLVRSCDTFRTISPESRNLIAEILFDSPVQKQSATTVSE